VPQGPGDYSGAPRVGPVGLAAALLLWAAGCAGPPTSPPPARAVEELRPGAIRGVCLTLGTDAAPSFDARLGALALEHLAAAGVRWISISPFGRQADLEATRIDFPYSGPYRWTEDDLIATIRAARDQGFSVLLSPHLWLGEELWRGDIRHQTEGGRRAWFDSYRAFILHHARLADREGVEMLSVGLELTGMVEHEPEWRRIIAEVRSIYRGRLTYAANWWPEVARVPFWDALDLIGVQFFYPLSDSPDATDADLRAGATAVRAELELLSERVGLPYLFTEAGYRSSPAPWVEPWVWRSEGPEDEAAQARCYRALVGAFRDAERFAGLFWWDWHLRPEGLRSEDRRFSPQGKEAEAVLRQAFGGE